MKSLRVGTSYEWPQIPLNPAGFNPQMVDRVDPLKIVVIPSKPPRGRIKPAGSASWEFWKARAEGKSAVEAADLAEPRLLWTEILPLVTASGLAHLATVLGWGFGGFLAILWGIQLYWMLRTKDLP